MSCEIIRFKALLKNQQVQLDWAAYCRQEVNYFVVERSVDQSFFEPVLRVRGRDVLKETESYTGTDDLAGTTAPVIYYRLRSVMKSGREIISAVIAVRQVLISQVSVKILPNPIKDQLQLLVVAGQNTRAEIMILDAGNRVLLQFSESILPGNNTLLYPQASHLPEGVYFLRIVLNGDILTKKFTKLK